MKKISFSILNTLTSTMSVIEQLIREIEEFLKDDKMIFIKVERKISSEKNKELKKKIEDIKNYLNQAIEKILKIINEIVEL
ncbi:MAG: hypothetical protein ACP5H7_03170 [Minisyncoccia bacterium]